MRTILHCGVVLGLLGAIGTAARADGPVARIDDDGMLVVAGRRMFVIGSYHNPGTADGLRKLRKAGFNLVSSEPKPESLSLIEKEGLLAWAPLGGLLAPANVAAEKKLTDTVRALAGRRELVAWEIADEALWNVWYGRQGRLEEERAHLGKLLRERQKSGAKLDAVNRLRADEAAAIKRADYLTAEELDRQIRKLLGAPPQNADLQLSRAPEVAEQLRTRLLRGRQLIQERDGRPVWMNYAPRNTLDDLRRYAEAADIVGCDIYPVPVAEGASRHSDLVNRGLTSVGDYTERFRQAGAGRPVWMVLQGFGWRDLRPNPAAAPADAGRRPTLRETRFMLYDAIVRGARGVLYWGTRYAQDPPAFLADLDVVVAEAAAQSALWSARDAALQPTASYAPTMGSVDRPPRVLAKQDGPRLGLLVVNEHPSGLQVRIAGLAAADGAAAAIVGAADGCALGRDGLVQKGQLTVFMPGESALVLSLGKAAGAEQNAK